MLDHIGFGVSAVDQAQVEPGSPSATVPRGDGLGR